MGKLHQCVGCNNSFASPQSLWNHKQRCLTYGKRQDPTPTLNQSSDKTKIIQNIINKGTEKNQDSVTHPIDRSKILGDIFDKPAPSHSDMTIKPLTKDIPSYLPKNPPEIPVEVSSKTQPTSLPAKKPENDSVPIEVEPKSYLPKEKIDFDNESDSESESERESSEESESESETEQKDAYRDLYVEFHRNLGMYSRIVQILDKLKMMDSSLIRYCNTIKESLQKRIGFSEGEKVHDSNKLVEEFLKLNDKLEENIEIYNTLVLMLDDMVSGNILTKEQCSLNKEHLKKKLAL